MDELVLALPAALRGHAEALRAQASRWIPDAADAFYFERALRPTQVHSDTLDLLFRVDWARGAPAPTAASSDPYLARCTAWRQRSQLAATCSSYIWFELDRLHELARADAAPGVSVCLQRGFGRGGGDATALPPARLDALYRELEEIYGGEFQGGRAVAHLRDALPPEASLLHASVMGGRPARRYKLYLTLPRRQLCTFLERAGWQGPRALLTAQLAQLQAEVGDGPEARLRVDLAFDAQLHPYLGLEFFAPRVPPVDPSRGALLGELRALGLIDAAEIDALISWCGSSRTPLAQARWPTRIDRWFDLKVLLDPSGARLKAYLGARVGTGLF